MCAAFQIAENVPSSFSMVSPLTLFPSLVVSFALLLDVILYFSRADRDYWNVANQPSEMLKVNRCS